MVGRYQPNTTEQAVIHQICSLGRYEKRHFGVYVGLLLSVPL